jgi:hypothetical protein
MILKENEILKFGLRMAYQRLKRDGKGSDHRNLEMTKTTRIDDILEYLNIHTDTTTAKGYCEWLPNSRDEQIKELNQLAGGSQITQPTMEMYSKTITDSKCNGQGSSLDENSLSESEAYRHSDPEILDFGFPLLEPQEHLFPQQQVSFTVDWQWDSEVYDALS